MQQQPLVALSTIGMELSIDPRRSMQHCSARSKAMHVLPREHGSLLDDNREHIYILLYMLFMLFFCQ